MAAISSEKVDLLIYGPIRPILENGFPDQFTVHRAENQEQPATKQIRIKAGILPVPAILVSDKAFDND